METIIGNKWKIMGNKWRIIGNKLNGKFVIMGNKWRIMGKKWRIFGSKWRIVIVGKSTFSQPCFHWLILSSSEGQINSGCVRYQ